MKVVQLSEQDRGIVRACVESTAIGNSTVEDLRSLLKAEDVLKIDDVPRGVNLHEMSTVPDQFELEDAQYDAIKKIVQGDGKKNLSKVVMRQYINCLDHIEVAVDKE